MATTQEYLSFGLAEELYALPIAQIREIIRLPPITRMPNAPAYFKGVVNLRGVIVPLVDLREEFGLTSEPYGPFTVVIVSESCGTPVGLVVDRVIDVLSLAAAEVRAPPEQLVARVKAEFILGLASAADHLLVLLDLDRIVTDEKRGILRGAVA